MKAELVTFVRIYLTEGERQLDSLLKQLHDIENVRGVTVFRGVTGFGKSGKFHSSQLLDLSSDLPLVVEFFDEPSKVERILSHLKDEFESGHVVQWPASVNV
jgi:PII-like signaling protein